MRLLKQSSASQPLTFLLVSSTDHITGLTGAAPTVKLSKSGAAGVSPVGVVSEVDATGHPGLYKIAGNVTDTNTLGPLWLHASAVGSDPVDIEHQIVAVDPQSANAFITGVNGIAPFEAGDEMTLTAAYDAAKTAAQAGDEMALTGAALTAIAAAVEGHLIDEADGQQLLTAIVAKINSTDVNLAGLSTATIAAAVWAYLLSNMTTPNSGGTAMATILAQANKIGLNTADSPNAVTAQTTISTIQATMLTASAFTSAYTPPDNTDLLALATMLENDPSNVGKKRLTAAATANIAGGGGGGGSPEWTLTGTSTSVDG